jgi:hypothetical protein
VTTERVMVLAETFSRNLVTASILHLAQIQTKVKTDGTGTLRFGSSSFPGAAMYENTGMDFLSRFYGAAAPAFFDIPDAQKVYQLVVAQQRRG